MKWTSTKDGIWPMFISECGRIYVTQLSRGLWSWTVFAGAWGTTKIAKGTASSATNAKSAALAA